MDEKAVRQSGIRSHGQRVKGYKLVRSYRIRKPDLANIQAIQNQELGQDQEQESEGSEKESVRHQRINKQYRIKELALRGSEARVKSIRGEFQSSNGLCKTTIPQSSAGLVQDTRTGDKGGGRGERQMFITATALYQYTSEGERQKQKEADIQRLEIYSDRYRDRERYGAEIQRLRQRQRLRERERDRQRETE